MPEMSLAALKGQWLSASDSYEAHYVRCPDADVDYCGTCERMAKAEQDSFDLFLDTADPDGAIPHND